MQVAVACAAAAVAQVAPLAAYAAAAVLAEPAVPVRQRQLLAPELHLQQASAPRLWAVLLSWHCQWGPAVVLATAYTMQGQWSLSLLRGCDSEQANAANVLGQMLCAATEATGPGCCVTVATEAPRLGCQSSSVECKNQSPSLLS